MNSQEKKNYLKRYKQMDEEINQKIEELTMWQAKATKITPSYSDMPKGSGEDRIQIAIDKICELGDEINEKIDQLHDMKKQIEQAIQTVPDHTLQTLLRYRYINGYSWNKISVKINKTIDYTKGALHGRALQEINL